MRPLQPLREILAGRDGNGLASVGQASSQIRRDHCMRRLKMQYADGPHWIVVLDASRRTTRSRTMPAASPAKRYNFPRRGFRDQRSGIVIHSISHASGEESFIRQGAVPPETRGDSVPGLLERPGSFEDACEWEAAFSASPLALGPQLRFERCPRHGDGKDTVQKKEARGAKSLRWTSRASARTAVRHQKWPLAPDSTLSAQ